MNLGWIVVGFIVGYTIVMVVGLIRSDVNLGWIVVGFIVGYTIVMVVGLIRSERRFAREMEEIDARHVLRMAEINREHRDFMTKLNQPKTVPLSELTEACEKSGPERVEMFL